MCVCVCVCWCVCLFDRLVVCFPLFVCLLFLLVSEFFSVCVCVRV